MLVFDGETLEDATLQVSRQTGVTFEFEDADLAAMRIGGYIRADDIDAFSALLEQNLDIRSTRQGDTILLRR